jgi:hypothetical protein
MRYPLRQTARLGNGGEKRIEGIMAELMDTRLYEEVKGILELARSKAYAAVNFGYEYIYPFGAD